MSRPGKDLAVVATEAKAYQQKAAQDPALLADPVIDAETQWVWVFDREIGAVQTVYEAVQSGVKPSLGAVRSAVDAGRKLLDIVNQARSQATALGAAEAVAP